MPVQWLAGPQSLNIEGAHGASVLSVRSPGTLQNATHEFELAIYRVLLLLILLRARSCLLYHLESRRQHWSYPALSLCVCICLCV